MNELKYIPEFLHNVAKKDIVHYKNTRLKTSYILNLIDTFLSKYIFLNKDKITINSRILKRLYGNNYNKYINYLIDNKFIYLWKNYSTGRHGKIYKLTDIVKEKKIIYINVNIPEKIVNKIKELRISRSSISDNIKTKLVNDLHKVKIDYKGAKYWLDNNYKNRREYLINITSCKKIRNNNIYYTFDRYGRLHTNFTTLKKHIRNNFLTINNYKLKELDITNSQPFFLYLLMKRNGFKDFNNFDKDVLSGVIYDKIKECENISRNEAKVNVYSVLFGRNMDKSKWDKIFNNMYPNVYRWIKAFKRKNNNYKIIAQMLQKIEAEFIFNTLINEIILYNKNIPIITIHDAILIPECNYNDIKIIFERELQNLLN